MDKKKRIDDFLKLISEISKNDIAINSNLVYANLIRLGCKKESINQYFSNWIDRYNNNRNIRVFVQSNWKYFCQFKSFNSVKTGYSKLKIYIPLDKQHIYDGANQIFDYVSENKIPHQSKIGSDIRFDDVVLRVDTKEDCKKISNFVANNRYLKEGLIDTNPFAYTDGNISFAWDGNLSYNTVVSEWVSDYINDRKLNNQLDSISTDDFTKFLVKKYDDIFNKGIGINDFALVRGFEDYTSELVNYSAVTRLLITSLVGGKLEDFYNQTDKILDPDYEVRMSEKINLLLRKDMHNDISMEQKEIFDYAFSVMANKEDEKSALKRFKAFILTGDYRLFTRDSNVRDMIVNGNMNVNVINSLISEMSKNSLMNASLKTMEKYDKKQVEVALKMAKTGDYRGFTNTDGAREELMNLVRPEEIDLLIEKTLHDKNYYTLSSSDNYKLYSSMIQNMMISKQK